MSAPSGFYAADRLQVASFEATGSIDGASKVTHGADGTLYCRLRPPRDWNLTEREGYERGWRAGKAGQPDDQDESFEWEHGHLDATEGRQKWHLAYCTDHGNHEGGCGA